MLDVNGSKAMILMCGIQETRANAQVAQLTKDLDAASDARTAAEESTEQAKRKAAQLSKMLAFRGQQMEAFVTVIATLQKEVCMSSCVLPIFFF